MKKIKVLQLIHALPTGGAETLVKNYCLYLDKDIFDVKLLCFTNAHSIYDEEIEMAGISVTYLDQLIFPEGYLCHSFKNKIKRYILLRYHLLRILREFKPDILHTHLSLNSLVWQVRPCKTVKIFHTVHSKPERLFAGRLSRKIDFYAAHNLAHQHGMRFIALHESMRQTLNKMFGVDNTIVLNNGIDLPRYQMDDVLREKIRRREGIPQDAFVIGHVGRFDPVKNHKKLLEAFAELCKLEANAFLLMIGDGSLKESVKAWLSEHGLKKRFKILSGRNDVPELLQAMDVFCFPSILEGLGIALIEAQAANLPCVVSEGVPQEAVVSNLVMRMSVEESPQKWADALLHHHVEHVVCSALGDWDIHDVCRKLGDIYLGQL